jgi:putative ABC transport system ATP-binding protein
VTVVEAEGLVKVFGRGEARVVALSDATIRVERGELVALMGPSGSGKTTLLRAVSLIDPPSRGRVAIAGEIVCDDGRVLTDDRRLRRRSMGIIFQSYNLIPFLTAAENVALPRRERPGRRALERAGARRPDPCRADTHPATLSGGETAAVAIARAVTNDPIVVLADEPTAALDTERGQGVDAPAPRGERHVGVVVVIRRAHAGGLRSRHHMTTAGSPTGPEPQAPTVTRKTGW